LKKGLNYSQLFNWVGNWVRISKCLYQFTDITDLVPNSLVTGSCNGTCSLMVNLVLWMNESYVSSESEMFQVVVRCLLRQVKLWVEVCYSDWQSMLVMYDNVTVIPFYENIIVRSFLLFFFYNYNLFPTLGYLDGLHQSYKLIVQSPSWVIVNLVKRISKDLFIC